MGLVQYADDGFFAPRKIAAALRTTSAEVARTAGLGRDAVQRKERVRSHKTQRRLREMMEIINKVEPRFGSALMAYAWYSLRTPTRLFGTDRDAARAQRTNGRSARLCRCGRCGRPCLITAMLYRGALFSRAQPDPSRPSPCPAESAELHGGRFNPKGCKLMANGHRAMLVRSFAPGATETYLNLVLWQWGASAPARLTLIDDENRLSR